MKFLKTILIIFIVLFIIIVIYAVLNSAVSFQETTNNDVSGKEVQTVVVTKSLD